MLLSVIIPCYNEAATVERIVQKVLDVPVEKQVIIVDDGSTDGSREIIREMAGKYPLTALFHPKTREKALRSRPAWPMPQVPTPSFRMPIWKPIR